MGLRINKSLIVWLLSLVTFAGVALTLDNPGSLDACYQLHVAQNLWRGRGMVEDVVWNYLDKSGAAEAFPHPSHLYWMPLTSWLAYLGLASFGAILAPFRAAQVPFVLLASLVPLLTYRLALTLWGRETYAVLAALLCLSAPNYLQVWVVPEPATPLCLATACCFMACTRARSSRAGGVIWLLAGGAAALAHLTHANGALTLVAAAIAAIVEARASAREQDREQDKTHQRGPRSALRNVALLTCGYLAVMAPWFARNLALIGSPLPVAVTRTAWLRSYDELFSFLLVPSAAHALADTSPLLARMVAALRVTFQFFAIFQFVLPLLAFAGLARVREERRALVTAPLGYGACLLVSMAFLFPYPAEYGSLFRGASALVPWLCALAPGALVQVGAVYARLRGGSAPSAERLLAAALLTASVLVALVFHVHRLYAIFPHAEHRWNQHLAHYGEIEAFLRARAETGPVIVADPPGYALATGRAAIVIPSDGPAALRAAADRYRARWLVLEADVPSLDAVWRAHAPLAGFAHVRTFRDDMGTPVRLLMRTP